MFRKTTTTILLLGMTITCLAQSDLVIYDADGDRMGILETASGSSLTLRTDDGYLFRIDTSDGSYGDNPTIGYLYFNDINCSAQAYIRELSNPEFNLSGRVFQVGLNDSDLFARTEWGQTFSTAGLIRRLNSDGICEPILELGEGMPATVIPIPDGVNEAGGMYFYAKPFSAVVETSSQELISCSGFESCPEPPPP